MINAKEAVYMADSSDEELRLYFDYPVKGICEMPDLFLPSDAPEDAVCTVCTLELCIDDKGHYSLFMNVTICTNNDEYLFVSDFAMMDRGRNYDDNTIPELLRIYGVQDPREKKCVVIDTTDTEGFHADEVVEDTERRAYLTVGGLIEALRRMTSIDGITFDTPVVINKGCSFSEDLFSLISSKDLYDSVFIKAEY